MERLDIEDIRKGIRCLARLSESQYSSILNALASCPPSLDARQLARYIVKQEPDLALRDALLTVNLGLNLHGLLITSGKSLRRFMPILRNYVHSIEGLELSEEELDEVWNRIKPLLEKSRAIQLSAKARELISDNVRVLIDARIISDIRPVFESEISEPPGAVILHTLKLEFIEDYERREFHVTLDSKDLKKLKLIIERAEEKSNLMDSLLKATDTLNIASKE